MIQVIERFHKILKYVAREPDLPRTVTELAKLLDVSTPACANIIKTMLQLGYLESKGARKGYTLGATPFLITGNTLYRKHLVEAAFPILEALVKDINEFIVLVTESAGKRFELIKLESEAMIQIKSTNSGGGSNLFRTATGAVMLAYKTEEQFRKYWDDNSEPERGIFKTENYQACRNKCAKIVKQGFFVSEPEIFAGDDELNKSCTMAFPVFEKNRIVAAVGSRVPLFRFKGERRKNILTKLKKSAVEISNLLKS
jgi:DNA-binding IclR family transcriptional regulator